MSVPTAGEAPVDAAEQAVPAGADEAASGGPGSAAEAISGEREGVAAVLDEFGGWGPKDRQFAFQRWHRGALSLVHLNVLAELESEGPTSMSHLADALDVSVASATGIVDRMERRGLVERRHDTDDRRVVLVHVAPAGADVFHGLASHRREQFARLLRELSDEDLDAVLRAARAMRAARARVMAASTDTAGAPADAGGTADASRTSHPDPATSTEGSDRP